jgi:hypothetical protein
MRVHFLRQVLSLFSMPFMRKFSHMSTLYRLPRVKRFLRNKHGVQSRSASWRQGLLLCVVVARTVVCISPSCNFLGLRLLGALAKLQKATTSFVISIYLAVSKEQLGSP